MKEAEAALIFYEAANARPEFDRYFKGVSLMNELRPMELPPTTHQPEAHRNWTAIMEGDDLNRIAYHIASWRISKGFETPYHVDGEMLGKLMLVVSELSEAAEACRDHDFPNFAEEIADTFIRLFDICGTVGIDIKTAVGMKMVKNEERPFKHGRESAV